MRLNREDFFGHTLIQKMSSLINKKTLNGFNYMYIKDKKLIKLLKDNDSWLDYIGITINKSKIKGTYIISWRNA